MTIDRRGSAKIRIAFEHQNAVSRAGIKRSRRQPSEAGADNDRIELSRHGTLSYDRRIHYFIAASVPFSIDSHQVDPAVIALCVLHRLVNAALNAVGQHLAAYTDPGDDPLEELEEDYAEDAGPPPPDPEREVEA